MLELILAASFTNKQQKSIIVQRASVKLDLLKFFLQIVWELKIFNNNKYQELSRLISELGRMLGGWQKQLLKETPPNGGE